MSATLAYFDLLSYINLNPEQGSQKTGHFWFCPVLAICQKTLVFFVFPVLAVHKPYYFLYFSQFFFLSRIPWFSLYFLYWLCINLIISCIFRNLFSVTNSLVFFVFPARVVPKPYYSLYEIDGPDTCRGLFVWAST